MDVYMLYVQIRKFPRDNPADGVFIKYYAQVTFIVVLLICF